MVSSIQYSGLPKWLSGKESACSAGDLQEMWLQSLGAEAPLEKETATHSSILAWKVLWREEPSGLQSIGLQGDPTSLSEKKSVLNIHWKD